MLLSQVNFPNVNKSQTSDKTFRTGYIFSSDDQSLTYTNTHERNKDTHTTGGIL